MAILPPTMSTEEKDSLRREFFAFCDKHNLCGWGVFLRPTAAAEPEPPGTTYGISYLSAMHVMQDLPDGAERFVIAAAANTMAQQAQFFQTALHHMDQARPTPETVLLHVPDSAPAANGDSP